MIRKCNIRNYSIYYKDGFLFSYYEYMGSDHDADMKLMAADPKTQEWWKLTDPCQEPLPTREKRASGGARWRKYFTRIRRAGRNSLLRGWRYADREWAKGRYRR